MVEVQNQTFQGCFDRLRLETLQENWSYGRVFSFSYQPQKDVSIQLNWLAMKLCCRVILAREKTLSTKKPRVLTSKIHSLILFLH